MNLLSPPTTFLLLLLSLVASIVDLVPIEEETNGWQSDYKRIMQVDESFNEIGHTRISASETLDILRRLQASLPKGSEQLAKVDALLDVAQVEIEQKCSAEYMSTMRNLLDQHVSKFNVKVFVEHYIDEELKFCGAFLRRLIDETLLSSIGSGQLREVGDMRTLVSSMIIASKLSINSLNVEIDKDVVGKAAMAFMRAKGGPIEDRVGRKRKDRETRFRNYFQESIGNVCGRVYSALKRPVDVFDQLEAYKHISVKGENLIYMKAGIICKKLLAHKETIVRELYEDFAEKHPPTVCGLPNCFQ